jgi:hypothetical protein
MTDRCHTNKLHSPTKAIREMCIQCMGSRENVGYQKLIKSCASSSCPNYAFRFGVNPYNKKTLTDEQRKKRADRLSVSILRQDSWENQN